MIIDTSAIVAILRAEPEAEAFARAIAEARSRRVSVVNFVEAAAVIDGSRDPIATRRFDELFREAHLVVESVTATQPSWQERPIASLGKEAAIPLG